MSAEDLAKENLAKGWPRCTPPMPPVAITSMPARAATHIVAATVVAPSSPRATAIARSRRLTLRTPFWVASRSSSPSVSPTLIFPSMMAIVAGTAPLSRTTCSRTCAVSRFCG